jgi:hypothetical protein
MEERGRGVNAQTCRQRRRVGVKEETEGQRGATHRYRRRNAVVTHLSRRTSREKDSEARTIWSFLANSAAPMECTGASPQRS